MSKVIPVPPNDRLVLELLEQQEEKTAGGLIMPATSAGKNDAVLRYRVVQVGPGLWSTDGLRRCPVMYGVGDVVLCNPPPAFREFSWEGRKLTVLNEADVLAGYKEAQAANDTDPRGSITVVDGDPTKAIVAAAERMLGSLAEAKVL